jgi:hypothetical protein
VAVSSRQAHLDLLARPSLLPLWSIIKVTPRFAFSSGNDHYLRIADLK